MCWHFFWRGVVNGLVGGMSYLDSRDELFSEFTRASNSLDTETVTAYAATVCVTFFHYGKDFFCEAGSTLFTFWNLEM